MFNEEIALCSSHAKGNTGYRKVPCSAQSFDAAVKGGFDGEERCMSFLAVLELIFIVTSVPQKQHNTALVLPSFRRLVNLKCSSFAEVMQADRLPSFCYCTTTKRVTEN